MSAESLRLQPGQERLTPEQEAESMRFARERIAAQLATEPADEAEAEALLRQAYQVAGLEAPAQIRWLDGPLQLVELFLPQPVWEHWMQTRGERLGQSVSVRERAPLPISRQRVLGSEWAKVSQRVRDRLDASVGYQVSGGVWKHVGMTVQAAIWGSMRDHVSIPERRRWPSLWDSLWGKVLESVEASVYVIRGSNWGFPHERGWDWDHEGVRDSIEEIHTASVAAYSAAPWLAYERFFDAYLEPNEQHAMAHFNELVSGYWLGHDLALLLRRPCRLERDEAGRLHCATGTCVEYRDGWGVYAWHGVQVSERVILHPDQLTREEFLNEPNLEARRIMQERMGQRFVPELGGMVIDVGPRGTLYEIRLPENDPERVARYVQVQDASTPRQYFVRVPPTIQTAAEAVAWSFSSSVEEYQPKQET